MLLPNGKVLVTNGSGVINTTYTGYGGNITYYVPKDSSNYDISASGLSGNIIYNGYGKLDGTSVLITYGNSNLTGITAPLLKKIVTYGCLELSNLIMPKATDIDATTCALTARSIGETLYAAYNENRAGVAFDFSSGTNAGATAINDYLVATHAVTLTTVKNKLVTTLGGTVIHNA